MSSADLKVARNRGDAEAPAPERTSAPLSLIPARDGTPQALLEQGVDSPAAPQSFENLIRGHLDRLYRLAYRLTGIGADAEDLLQDVLIKLYRRRDELTSIADLSPWLARVLYNQFVDQRRRYRRQRMLSVDVAGPVNAPDALDAFPSGEPGPEASAGSAFDISRLEAAMQQLSEAHREVVLLHDAEGYPLEEIHKITAVPVGTLKSRLHRARARLRELLADGT